MTRTGDRGTFWKLYLEGHRQVDIIRMLGWTRAKRGYVSNVIRIYAATQCLTSQKRSGRPRSARTPELVRKVKGRIQRNPRRSLRKLARSMGTSDRTIRR